MKLNVHLVFLISCVSFIICHEDDIHTIQLSTSTFDEEISKKDHFIMFFAPWCSHCQRLASTWEQLAEMLNIDDSNVKIAKVDCTIDSDICSRQDITGYPTLKFFKVGKSEAIRFRGTRDLPSLTNFINEQMNEGNKQEINDEVSLPAISGLIELNDKTFDKHIASGKHFVKFYAPWCGHCQKLAPTWDELAKVFELEPEVSIAKLDCTQFRSLCNDFDVKGYPTLLWIEDGKKIEKYQGERSMEELEQYVNKMLGAKEAASNKDESPGSSLGHVLELSGENFQDNIKHGLLFIKFFAPWCGHCKRLAPTWEELGKKYKDNPEVNIIKVDCTLEVNKDLCNEQEIDGFPTIFIYKNGQKISEYSGTRTLEDLSEFVQKHLLHDEL